MRIITLKNTYICEKNIKLVHTQNLDLVHWKVLSENEIKLLISEYRVTNTLVTYLVMNKCHKFTEDNQFYHHYGNKKFRAIFVLD
jgi:hypothetical protein